MPRAGPRRSRRWCSARSVWPGQRPTWRRSFFPEATVLNVEFAEVVRRRRMVRNYDPDRPVPDDIRERILSNALHAPSAGFSQGWAFLVLEGHDRDRFWRATAPDERDQWV